MRKLASIVVVVGAVAFAACFGYGPVPTPPAGATVVFTVPIGSNTCDVPYIGNVALGSAASYALLVQYSPSSNCGGGAMNLSEGYSVYRFGNGSSEYLGSLPASSNMMSSNPPEPFVATSGGDPAYAYVGPGQIEVDYATEVLTGSASGTPIAGSGSMPVGIVTDGPNTYIALTSNTGRSHPNNPEYPCCGLAQEGINTNGGTIITMPGKTSTTVNLVCDRATARCMAANTTSLFFLQSSTSFFSIGMVPKVGGVPTTVGTQSPQHDNTTPVAVDADDKRVAWASTVHLAQNPPPNALGCEISYFDFSSGMTTTAFSTTNFSCMDLALDGDVLWFTIVSLRHQNDDDSSSNVSVKGDGLGRLDLTTGTLDSVDFGLAGYNTGPRRVYVVGGALFAVDPKAIARIDKAAIVGHHDFMP